MKDLHTFAPGDVSRRPEPLAAARRHQQSEAA